MCSTPSNVYQRNPISRPNLCPEVVPIAGLIELEAVEPWLSDARVTTSGPPRGDTVRAYVQRSLAVAIVSLAAGLSGRALAQQLVEEPEEIIVRAKPLNRYRAEI